MRCWGNFLAAAVAALLFSGAAKKPQPPKNLFNPLETFAPLALPATDIDRDGAPGYGFGLLYSDDPLFFEFVGATPETPEVTYRLPRGDYSYAPLVNSASLDVPASLLVAPLLPITEDAAVVALDDEGLLRFDLSAARLGALLAAQGLTLRLGLADDAPDAADDALGQVDAELEQEFGEAFEQLDDAADDLPGFGMPDAGDTGLFAPDPVRVAEFSRRGPWAARLTAQLLDTPVDYLEDSAWSVYRYRTDRAHGAIAGGRSTASPSERPCTGVLSIAAI